MSTPQHGAGGPSLREALLRRLPLLATLVLVTFGAAWIVSSSLPATYRATATVTFTQNAGTRLALSGEPVLPDRALALRAQHATLPEVLRAANAALEDRDLQVGTLSVQPDPFLGAISITASTDSASDSATIATAVAEAAAAWERADSEQAVEEAVQRLEAVIEQATAEVEALEAGFEEEPEGRVAEAELNDAVGRLLAAQRQIDDLRLDAATTGSGIDAVEPATVPRRPVSPVPMRDATVAALMAAIAAVGLIWYRQVSRAEWAVVAEETMGAPVLAEISPAGDDPLEDLGRVHEVDAVLRMALHAMRQRSARALTVCATAPDPIPTLAVELAHAAVRSGGTVLLVDAAMAPGRDVWLARRENLIRTHARPIHATSLDGPAVRTTPLAPGLETVTLGELLRSGSEATVQDLLEGSSRYDVVVVDAPPVGDSIASIVLESARAVVVAVTPGATTAELSACRRTLDLLGATPLGFVVAKARRGRAPLSETVSAG